MLIELVSVYLLLLIVADAIEQRATPHYQQSPCLDSMLVIVVKGCECCRDETIQGFCLGLAAVDHVNEVTSTEQANSAAQ